MTETNRIIGGRYALRQLIGRGGMAEVHIGSDTRLNRIVAIKILRQDLARDPIFQARFRREAQSAANLNHPSIVAVYDTGEEAITASDGTAVQVPYIVMEYVEGHTVKELLTDGNPVPIDEAVSIVSGVLDALEYAHHQNLVHRDIKPGNVMITTTGKVKVMDFGIARALTDSQATMTQTDAVVGTAQYLSPEQARGEQVDARSDLYSTGCLLFELLTGQPPFKGDSAVAVAFQHVSQLPPLPSSIASDIPEALDRVVMKALAKNREERYADANSMRADLQAAERGASVAAPLATSWNPPETGATAVLPPVASGGAGLGARPGGGGYPSNAFRDPYSPVEAGMATATMSAVGRPGAKKKRPVVPIVLGVLSAVIVVAIVAMAFVLLNGESQDTTTVEVPDMTGMNQEQVRAALTEAQLNMTMGPAQNSESVAEGLFLKSTPEPGTKVEPRTKVKVVFSLGRGETHVPQLTGMTQEQAREALKAVGLNLGNVSTTDTGSVDKNRIVSSSPKEGEPIRRGDSVDIEVASGNVLVPSSLLNGTLSNLQQFVYTNRLILSTTEQETKDATPGTVLQLDKAGQLVAQGSTLQAVVAVAPTEPSPGPSSSTDPSSSPSPSDDKGKNGV